MSHLIQLVSFLREGPEWAVVLMRIQSFDNWALLAQLQDEGKDVKSREMSQYRTRRNWQKTNLIIPFITVAEATRRQLWCPPPSCSLMFSFPSCDGKSILDSKSS